MAENSRRRTRRERLSLNRGWKFHLGDIPFPIIRGHPDSYSNAKAGRALGAASPEHDDSSWREVDLPHDWAVESIFDPKENLSQGYRRRGVSWYRRRFALSSDDVGQHIELQFDGVATHCTVWVNGSLAHRNWCGYTSFSIDVTPFATFGAETNIIAVRVDAQAMEGWWYEGAGIYRHTWLVKRSKVHVKTDGVYANPVRDASGRWTVPVEVVIANYGIDAEKVTVDLHLRDSSGRSIAHADFDAIVGPLGETIGTCELAVLNPRLWSVEKPVLHALETSLLSNGVHLDAVRTQCGFRTIRFDPNEGFFLNGKHLKLQGVCCHQDHAGVGVAIPDSIWEFRIRRLKEMGVNAYRCAHNPPSAELLDLCDRIGILVMDETRHFNPTPEYMRQLEWLLRRDRNHPSIILWSVFNEEPMQGTRAGYESARRMVALVKQLDSTRPATAAMNGGLFAEINVSQAVDVVGFNYQSEHYDQFHLKNPHLPLVSSEDTSAYMTRGAFQTDKALNIMGSYDTEYAPWGASHRSGWKAVAERRFLAGGFVWTGFDYRGEPTPFHWPSIGSFFGCMDLCGFPKTAYFLRRAQWITSRPVLHLVPHWNWEGREGEPIRVMACTNSESVALFLNGRSLGEKAVDRYEMVHWDVPFEPGKLVALGRTNAKEVARAFIETTGEPVALRLSPDRGYLYGDGADAQPVTVEAVDSRGRGCPTSSAAVAFELVGPGRILGHGNGDPNSHEAENGPQRTLFNGLAQVIVQSLPNGRGPLVLRAISVGLSSVEIAIEIRRRPPTESVPTGEPVLFLHRWRVSPHTVTRPDPNHEVAENDMNTWAGTLPGDLQSFKTQGFAIYRIRFVPYRSVQEMGGELDFTSITGAAEVWLDKTLIATKTNAATGSLVARLPKKTGERLLNVMIRSKRGEPVGLSGPVSIREMDQNSVTRSPRKPRRVGQTLPR